MRQDLIKFNSALNFFNFKLKNKTFKILINNHEVNRKLTNYFKIAFLNKKRKIYKKFFLSFLLKDHYSLMKKYYYIVNLFLEKKKVKVNSFISLIQLLFAFIFFKGLKLNLNESKDQQTKNKLIEKLKNTAALLLLEQSKKQQ